MFSEAHKAALAEHGFCVLENVLTREEVKRARTHLVGAAEESERRGIPTYIENLDPNDANVRVFNLLDLSPTFVDLIAHPVALEVVAHLLTHDFIISNFTANIARPGSKSMVAHSDLAVVLPEPWHAPWSMNIIWCLDDVHEANGATRYLPGSHNYQTRAELPTSFVDQMIPFEAPAGSVIAMDGRVWHTSGQNVTESEERALLFGYYSRSFIRPQWNFTAALSDETKATLSPELQHRLGLGITANVNPLTGID